MAHLNVKLLKEYAYKVLGIALKYDELDRYILGFPLYTVKTKNEMGQEECIFAKMEAIYQYYKDNPASQIEKKLENLLVELSLNGKSSEALINILRTIEYQIIAEKENRAPFTMDNDLLLNNLKKNLQENREIYQSESYNKIGFMATMRQHDEMLSRNYGYKIL